MQGSAVTQKSDLKYLKVLYLVFLLLDKDPILRNAFP